MKSARTSFAVALLLLAAGGCDELTSGTQAVSLLTAAPDLANARGMDPGLAAQLPFDAFAEMNPAGDTTAIFVGLGEREDLTSTEPPTPVTGATVELSWTGGRITLCENDAADAAGTYSAIGVVTAPCAADLNYMPGDRYTTIINTDSEEYVLRVDAPPVIDGSQVVFIPAFGTATVGGASIPSHNGGQLDITWHNATAASDRNAFVTMMRIRQLAGGGWQADPQPVFDNSPKDPGAMVALIIEDPVTRTTVPAATFDSTGLYFLVLTPAELSTDTDNLGIGSGTLAGKGTAFVFWVP